MSTQKCSKPKKTAFCHVAIVFKIQESLKKDGEKKVLDF